MQYIHILVFLLGIQTFTELFLLDNKASKCTQTSAF